MARTAATDGRAGGWIRRAGRRADGSDLFLSEKTLPNLIRLGRVSPNKLNARWWATNRRSLDRPRGGLRAAAGLPAAAAAVPHARSPARRLLPARRPLSRGPSPTARRPPPTRPPVVAARHRHFRRSSPARRRGRRPARPSARARLRAARCPLLAAARPSPPPAIATFATHGPPVRRQTGQTGQSLNLRAC